MHAHKNNKVNLSVTGERCDKRALNVNCTLADCFKTLLWKIHQVSLIKYV